MNLKPRAALPEESDIVRAEFETFVNTTLSQYEVIEQIDFTDFLGGINSGYDCIEREIDCQGDNRDTAYKISDVVSISLQTKLLVFGVNHARFDKAIYASMDVYNNSNKFGFAGFLAPLSRRFYSITIGHGLRNDIIVPLEYTDLFLAERAYVQLPENIAPTYDSIITPQAYLIRV
jgi:hypothetical protein